MSYKRIAYLSLIINIAVGIIAIRFLAYPQEFLVLREGLKQSINPYEPDAVVLRIKNQISAQPLKDETELTDRIRKFVYQNSEHNEGTSYHKNVALNFDKRFQVLSDLENFSNGNDFKPQLSCSPRSWAMAEILRAFDIPFRLVTIYFTENTPGNLTSHTFLEVQNPTTSRWEIYDPDNDIIYVNNKGQRLSSLDLMNVTDKSVVRVCADIDNCRDEKRNWLMHRQSFKAIKYNYLGLSHHQDMVIIDGDYYDLEERLENINASLTEHFSNVATYIF
ncbi:hypothetical protein [Reichenbachiella sp.]